MKIAIGNDHAATAEKLELLTCLEEAGHQVDNLGTDEMASSDYPDHALAVANMVSSREVDFGILLCGTGIGISIAANKVKGIRAALCHSVATAKMAREHNDANILCVGARVLDLNLIKEIATAFLGASFEGGRHEGRVGKIMAMERES